jgi:hypothetical protein
MGGVGTFELGEGVGVGVGVGVGAGAVAAPLTLLLPPPPPQPLKPTARLINSAISRQRNTCVLVAIFLTQ